MFRRILLDHWMALFPLVAFVTAASVYVSITYRALRMRSSQVERFANLPFNDQPDARHEHADKS